MIKAEIIMLKSSKFQSIKFGKISDKNRKTRPFAIFLMVRKPSIQKDVGNMDQLSHNFSQNPFNTSNHDLLSYKNFKFSLSLFDE
jgi:hypothetical protein